MGIDSSIISKANKQLGISNSQDFDDLISDILAGPLSLEDRQAKLDILGDIYERVKTLLQFGTTIDNFIT